MTRYFLKTVNGVVTGTIVKDIPNGMVDFGVPVGFREVFDTVYALADVGYTDNGDGTFTPPLANVRLTLGQFSDLFSQESVVAIYVARQQDPQVGALYDRLQLEPEVLLASPRVALGLDLLVSKGLITADDKTRILSNTPPTQ